MVLLSLLCVTASNIKGTPSLLSRTREGYQIPVRDEANMISAGTYSYFSYIQRSLLAAVQPNLQPVEEEENRELRFGLINMTSFLLQITKRVTSETCFDKMDSNISIR